MIDKTLNPEFLIFSRNVPLNLAQTLQRYEKNFKVQLEQMFQCIFRFVRVQYVHYLQL